LSLVFIHIFLKKKSLERNIKKYGKKITLNSKQSRIILMRVWYLVG